MDRLVLYALCAVVLASCAAATDPTTLASLGAANLTATVNSFNVAGTLKAVNTTAPVCNAQIPGSACLTALNHGDKVNISYAIKPTYKGSTNGTIQLRGCFSNWTKVDRPWRATNAVLALDKQCSLKIASGLAAKNGSYVWTVPETVPMAVVFVRAYLYIPKNISGVVTPSPAAFGNSATYFQLNKINSRPSELWGSTLGLSFLGPVTLVLLFSWDKFMKKKH